jgi:hypothetical protein
MVLVGMSVLMVLFTAAGLANASVYNSKGGQAGHHRGRGHRESRRHSGWQAARDGRAGGGTGV